MAGDNLGLLILGDQLGFLYIIQLTKHEGHQDQLLYMANLSQSSNQEARSIIAAKFISCLDIKFARMTADGDLSVFEAYIDQEDQLSDSIQVTRLHQIQTFEELSQNF